MTLSTRYFVEAGSTNPDSRLMAMSTKPSASSPRLGFISAQTSGRFFHAFLRFSLLAGDLEAVSVVMIGRRTIPHGFDASSVRMTILRKRTGGSSYLQSPADPARGTMGLAGQARRHTA